MATGTKTGLAIAGAVVLLGVVLVFMGISYSNGEVRLRNQIGAQQKSNEAVFDNTWKIIQQQAGVASEYRDAFAKIYPELMQGRHYEKGGALFKMITEANPVFDVRLYEKLANSIEAQRTVFTREQQRLIDLKREHDNLRTTFPATMFVGGRPEIAIAIVTSTKTAETFGSGKEDDVELFKDGKK